MTTWKDELKDEMQKRGEELTDLVANTLTLEEMMTEFDAGYGGTEGVSFTAWTANTVYFPMCDDGAEWVGSVARNPDGKPTDHQGGR
jgi:hypothetical protein